MNRILKYFELFKPSTEVERILKKYFKIEGTPTINPDGTVDIEGHCELKKKTDKLPAKFGKVSGNFDCHNNQLSSLEGAPQSVGGAFYCNYNQLTSLVGAPQSVGGDFYCYDNQLTSLVGAPQSVGGIFYCNWAPTLPLLRTVVAKEVVIYKGNNQFKEIMDILNSSIKNNPGSYRKAAIDARRKLIDAGFEGNAKW
jgi:hypothetical protein